MLNALQLHSKLPAGSFRILIKSRPGIRGLKPNPYSSGFNFVILWILGNQLFAFAQSSLIEAILKQYPELQPMIYGFMDASNRFIIVDPLEMVSHRICETFQKAIVIDYLVKLGVATPPYDHIFDEEKLAYVQSSRILSFDLENLDAYYHWYQQNLLRIQLCDLLKQRLVELGLMNLDLTSVYQGLI